MRVSERVENILKVSQKARNSDLELWLIYAKKSGLSLSKEQEEVLREMPSFETIRRTRQKLQEQGLYPADEEVNEARYKKFKEVRQNIRDVEPDVLIEPTKYIIKEWGEY